MINFGSRDAHYFREKTEMLENQNRFLESEFQRQLDKIVMEKNEQIARLIQIIDQTCPPPTEYIDHISDVTQSTGIRHDLSGKSTIVVRSRSSRSLITEIHATEC